MEGRKGFDEKFFEGAGFGAEEGAGLGVAMKHQYPNLPLDRLRFRIGGIRMGSSVVLFLVVLLLLLGGRSGIGRRCRRSR